MPGEKGFLSLIVAALIAGYLPYSAGSAAVARATLKAAPQAAAAAVDATSPSQPVLADAVSLIADHFGLAAPVPANAAQPPADATTDPKYVDANGRLTSLKLPAGTSAEFVIATLPDPIDSNARWQFDPLYDSVQSAIGATDFAFDRFYLPDWDVSTNTRADQRTTPRLHERLPGVALFRKQTASGTHFLVLELVFETATGGIHQMALRQAIRTVIDACAAATSLTCTDADGHPSSRPVIRIIGPTFSGSIPSLGDAINAIGHEHQTAIKYRIVSGSATGGDNAASLLRAAVASLAPDQQPDITYRTTVLTDDALFPVLATYLATHVDSEHERVAILLESNTTYGNDLRRVICHSGSPCGYELLPFPLHISRLRSALDGTAAQPPSSTAAGRSVPLLLGEPVPPRDQMPSVEPSLTSSSIDVTLDQILSTIEREHVSVIGLFATDARDKLFLAQQISLRSPDALLVTIDGDLLFMHPDYLQYTRGMIIASSYPLFTGTQLWSPIVTGNVARHQFPSSNAEGVYNAAVALLQYQTNGVAVDRARATPLIDYKSASPSGAGAGPYAWISTVGRDAIWPVRQDAAACTPCGAYIAATSTSSLDDRPTHPSGIMNALLASMQFFVGWYAFRRWFHPRERDDGRGADIIILQLVAYVALLAMEAFAIVLLKAYDEQLLVYSGPELATTRIVTTGVMSAAVVMSCLLAATAIDDLAIRSRTRRLPQLSFRSRELAWSSRPYWVVPTAATAVLLIGFPTLPVRTSQLLGGEPLVTLNRSFQLFNGVSPAVPLMIVLVAMFAWAECQLMRATTPLMGAALIQPNLRRMDALATGGLLTLASATAAAARRSALFRWPVMSAMLLSVTASGFAVLMWIGRVQTMEKTSFDMAFLAGWYVLQMFVWIALIDHVMLWRDLRALLKGLGVHPLAPSFKRLPTELFSSRLGPRRPRTIHLQHAMNAGIAAGRDMNTLQSKLDDALHHPRVDVALSSAWFQLLADVAAVTSPVGEASQPFVVLPIALLVRDFGARVARGIYVVFGALFSLVLYQMSFRAYPRGIMLGVTWFYVVAGIGLALETVVAAERNTVLSYLAGTEPGKIQWDSVFITRTVLPLVFALFTLFAMQFPHAGGMLLQWLRPVQTALP